jgi:GGDEF domain-containing protein
VFSQASLELARRDAARFQSQLASRSSQQPGEPICLAASVGISTLDASGETASSRSDIARCCVRRGGRNRLEHF